MKLWQQFSFQYLPIRWKRLAHVLTVFPMVVSWFLWQNGPLVEKDFWNIIILTPLISIFTSYTIYPFYNQTK